MAHRMAPEVDEHVVAVQIPVLGMEVVSVKPQQSPPTGIVRERPVLTRAPLSLTRAVMLTSRSAAARSSWRRPRASPMRMPVS